MCIFPSPAFPFSIIKYQNLPPSALRFFQNIFKNPFIFVSYLLMPYFCIRFPRDGQHLILTCCNGVGSALQNNKNNFFLFGSLTIKLLSLQSDSRARASLVVFLSPFQRGFLEIKDGIEKLPKNIWRFKINSHLCNCLFVETKQNLKRRVLLKKLINNTSDRQ